MGRAIDGTAPDKPGAAREIATHLSGARNDKKRRASSEDSSC